MPAAIDLELERRIVEALWGGMTHREAVRQFGIARITIQRIAAGRPARRKAVPMVQPHRVPKFRCPECRKESRLKWDPADKICYVCHVRETDRLNRRGVAL